MSEPTQVEKHDPGEIYRVEPPAVTATPDGEVHTLFAAYDNEAGQRVPMGLVISGPHTDVVVEKWGYFKSQTTSHKIPTTKIKAISGDQTVFERIVSSTVEDGPINKRRLRTPQELAEVSSSLQEEAGKVVLAHFGLDFDPEKSPEEK
ncbi:MAG: hypothetical protein AAB436_03580 [Patescibacteria group bacterium]